ncbi:hypothetical protein ACHAWF_002751 [Thalassiosira exigua]
MMRSSLRLNVLETLFSMTAFILMWIGGIRCNFVKFTSMSGSSEPITRQFGIWYYEFISSVTSVDGTYLVQTCHSYPDYVDIDPAWKAAKAFSIITFILAILMFIACVVTACSVDPERPMTYAFMAPMYLLLSACQGFMLLFLQSNGCKDNVLASYGALDFPETCSISKGAKLCISALVFWAAAGVSSFFAHQAEQAERSGPSEADLVQPLAEQET